MKTIAQELCDLLPNYVPPTRRTNDGILTVQNNKRKILNMVKRGDSVANIGRSIGVNPAKLSSLVEVVFSDQEYDEYKLNARKNNSRILTN